MTAGRALGLLPGAIAFAMTLAYALWLQPEWEPLRDDQQQYLALARGLSDRAEFTRAVAGEPFIPEPLRAPGYPLFLAGLCRTTGCDQWQVALAQAVLFAAMALGVSAFARRIMSPRAALAAGVSTALYPAFAFSAALAHSDLLATALVLAAAGALARGGLGGAGLAGLALGLAALTRPFFLLAPIAFAAVYLLRGPVRPSRLAAMVAAFLLAVSPLFVYSSAVFGRPLVGSGGTQLWLGYFQLRGDDLDPFERSHAEAGARQLADFVAESDRSRQPALFLELDRTLGTRAVALVAHDPVGYAARAVPRSVALWAGDVPAKAGVRLPLAVRVLDVATDLALLAVGIAGAVALARRSADVAGALPLAVIGYVWLLSLPLWAEERFSLPAKPFLIIAAVAAVGMLLRRRRAAPRR